jgi:DNA anti-recombination protein RmuC
MRAFIVIVLLLAVGIGITGFALGWFSFSSAPNEGKQDVTLSVDPAKIKKDRDSVLGWFHKKTDTTAAGEGKTDRAEFQKQAETQLTAMDRKLNDMKVKAKTAGNDTKDAMNKEIGDLTQRTEAAREELKELRTASEERYESMRTHTEAALNELQNGFEKAASRFQ